MIYQLLVANTDKS